MQGDAVEEVKGEAAVVVVGIVGHAAEAEGKEQVRELQNQQERKERVREVLNHQGEEVKLGVFSKSQGSSQDLIQPFNFRCETRTYYI